MPLDGDRVSMHVLNAVWGLFQALDRLEMQKA